MRLFALVFALIAFFALACGGPETKDALQTRSPEKKGSASVEKAAADTLVYAEKLPTWQRTSAARFKSEGHGEVFLETFVNPLGAATVGTGEVFEEGSALAAVAYPSENEPNPSFTLFMVKMPAGSNPEGGDWFFGRVEGGGLTLAGDARQTDVSEACSNCHKFGARATDFVFGAPRPDT